MRGGYQDLAAKGLMTYEELGEKLEGLKAIRETAARELEALRDRQERIERLERDKDELLNSYAKMAPKALEGLSPEERHRLYRLLRLKVVVNPTEVERSLEVSGHWEQSLYNQKRYQDSSLKRSMDVSENTQ